MIVIRRPAKPKHYIPLPRGSLSGVSQFHPQTPKDGVCGDYCLYFTDEETWARGG